MDLPAQNLAMDIVREIFKHFSTHIVIPGPPEVRRGLRPFPWYLGHICSSWRVAFFSMYSEFWSTITFDVRYRYPHSAVEVTEVFLERTEGRPFSFAIDAKRPYSHILDLFIAESTRWKGVSLCLDNSDKNIPLFQSIKNRIPQLCSLTIDTKFGMPRGLPLIFEDVPALTHLSLTDLGNWQMDWSLLTQLELSRELNVGQLLRVLSQATNLERLGFNKLMAEQLDENNCESVTLPRLRILEISGSAILHFLTTPALQGLYIYKSRHEPVSEVYASFLTRSSCQLQRFGAFRFWLQNFVKILPYMPDLKVMTLCNPMDMPIFVKAMTCRTGEQPLMPQLRVLRVEDRLWHHVNSLKKMLESRVSDRCLHPVQELKVLVVVGSRQRQYYDKCEFQHPQLRLVDQDLDQDAISEFQWLCDDLDY